MAETDSISTTASPPPPSESENPATLPTMEKEPEDVMEKEPEDVMEKEPEDVMEKEPEDVMEKKPNPGDISLRIWPPTQKTRDTVVNRLIETLTTESILSKRSGTIQSEEASSIAKSIEDEAYGVASAAVLSDDDGIEILKAYSKEISTRMLESVKARSPVASPTPTACDRTELAADSNSVTTEPAKDDDAPADSVKLDEA